jgi:hypothetical protein
MDLHIPHAIYSGSEFLNKDEMWFIYKNMSSVISRNAVYVDPYILGVSCDIIVEKESSVMKTKCGYFK